MEVRLVQSLCKRGELREMIWLMLYRAKGLTINNLNKFIVLYFEDQALSGLKPIPDPGRGQDSDKTVTNPSLKAGVSGYTPYWGFSPEGSTTRRCSCYLLSVHKVIFLLIILFSGCGMRDAYCGSSKSEIPNLSSTQIGDPKSNISRDEAIKLFTDANEKYLQAAKNIAARNNQEAEIKLKEAVSQYETILTDGFEHGQIFYNLGNTYYRMGELGMAILNYRKAQRLIPRNADLNANLRLAKNSTEDKELPNEIPLVIRRMFFWFFLLSVNELIVAAVSLYVVLMTLLFFLIILKYGWLKRFVIGFTVGVFIAVVSVGIKIYREQGVNHGVITTTKCQVRYGPGEEYEPKFEIHDGAECLIEGERDDWYNVYVYVGVKQDTESKTGSEEKVSKEVRKGWLQKKDVGII